MPVPVLLQASSDSTFEHLAAWAGRVAEAAGILVILLGALLATGLFARQALRRSGFHEAFEAYRRHLGRAILLGLEFMVAADIIGTVIVDPTFANVGVLGALVLVRTFLSISLTVEIEGRWPWQRAAAPRTGPPAPAPL